MSGAPYDLAPPLAPRLGLIVLQSDETIEAEFRRLIPSDALLAVSRVPSAEEVSEASLAEMSSHITNAARLLPRGAPFDAVAYACTSGASVIGPDRVADLMRRGVDAAATTDPASAIIAACAALSLRRLALLSPYVEEVSGRLCAVLASNGVETPAFASFEEPEEAKVTRIAAGSIIEAATNLIEGAEVEGLFLSCTNLRTLDVIEPLERATGMPVISSNLALAWRVQRLAGINGALAGPGWLMRA